jgi:hypothetical protein
MKLETVVVDNNDGNLDLSGLNLSQELVEALANRGITHLFPIQVRFLLEGNKL